MIDGFFSIWEFWEFFCKLRLCIERFICVDSFCFLQTIPLQLDFVLWQKVEEPFWDPFSACLFSKLKAVNSENLKFNSKNFQKNTSFNLLFADLDHSRFRKTKDKIAE